MEQSQRLSELAARATGVEQAMEEALRRLRVAPVADRPALNDDLERLHAQKREISGEAAAITVRQGEGHRQKARVEASPDDPRLDMDNLARALKQAMAWRRDESSYLVDGIRALPTLWVVAAWDDGVFIHFVLHVLAGDEEGFLGYCYEDDPSRWSWQVSDIAAQEVSLLSDQWFYGENLVPKIKGAKPGQIRWQAPVPEKSLPMNMEELRTADMGQSAWRDAGYFPAG
jgi:hypothetical protein